MASWREWIPTFIRGHRPCPRCEIQMHFTGEPALNPAEELVAKLSAGRRSVSLHWLEQQIARDLYGVELKRGAWITDLGVLGPTSFQKEAIGILTDVRPQFGRLIKEEKAERN